MVPRQDDSFAIFDSRPGHSDVFRFSFTVKIALILLLSAIILLYFRTEFNVDEFAVALPVVSCCFIFLVFSLLLAKKTNTGIFGEIGFIYLVFSLAYTVVPAFTLISTGYKILLGFDGQKVLILYPTAAEVALHLWRHFIFISGFALGYLVLRGSVSDNRLICNDECNTYGFIIVFLILIMLACVLTLLLMSSPVNSYIDHYTRFNHLSWLSMRIVHVCLIIKSGGYFVLLSLMFSNYNKYKRWIFIIVPIMCIFETVYSYGSRIETLIVLLAFVGFYHFKSRMITIKKGVIYLLSLSVLFSGIELVRSARGDMRDVSYYVATEGIKSASEFGSVFNASFHLYSERADNSLPQREWQMFFHDITALIPFIDHTTNHPEYWYARNYFPNAVVPPQTMGVIADSALWGGEIDLFVRSLINGILFAILVRWFTVRRNKWWALTIYIYCYATCIMTLKYSVLWHLAPFFRVLAPVLLLTSIVYRFQKFILYYKVKRYV